MPQCVLVLWEGGGGASPGLVGQPVLSSQPNPSAIRNYLRNKVGSN